MPDSQPDDRNPGSSPGEEVERNPGLSPGLEAEAEGLDGKTAAESSTADEGGDLLAEMKAALGSEEETAPDSVSGQDEETAGKPKVETEGDKPEEEDEGDPDDPLEEELSRYSPKARKRIDDLLEQRTELRKKLEALEPKANRLEELEPKAQGFDRILEFTQQANLTPDDVNVIFEVGSLIKNNPRAALERLEPIYQQLRQVAGETLTPDLRERVRLGYMTEQDALQMSRARAAEMHARAEAERQRQQMEAYQHHTQQQAATDSIKAKVSEWEASKAGSDPDWKLKADTVQTLMELEVRRRRDSGRGVQSPEEAVAIAEQAYAKATAELKRLAPKRTEVRPVTGRSSDHRTPEPASMLDAMKQAAGV